MVEDKYVHFVAGASLNPARYSHMAVKRLSEIGKTIYAWGLRAGKIGDVDVHLDFPLEHKHVHTITLYMNPQRQEEWLDAFISLKPKRIIFNPGTEHPKLMEMADKAGIECLEACTLVMVASRTYD